MKDRLSTLVGNKIKALREGHGFSQNEFCRTFELYTGHRLPKSTLSSWETGDKRPKYEALLSLSRIFRVPADEILCRNEYAGDAKDSSEGEL